MARLEPDSSFDLSREIAALRSFHVQYARKAVGLIYGPKSREDKYYIDHCPKEQLAFTALMDSFERLGLAVTHIDPTGLSFLESLMGCDICFLNMHGEYGEDGSLQGLLDYLQKPYTGSGVLASAVGLNKVMFKYVLLGSGVSTPPFHYCSSTPRESIDNVLDSLTCPILAKPISGGSSIGMRLLANPTQVARYLREEVDLKHGPIFFERFITGRALTVGVLELEYGVAVTPVTEVHCDSTFYDENIKLDAREKALFGTISPLFLILVRNPRSRGPLYEFTSFLVV